VSNGGANRGRSIGEFELPATLRAAMGLVQALIDIDFHFHLGTALRSFGAMTDRIDVRTELAASPHMRVEIGEDGVLHVLAGPITLHLDRDACEELTTTLARAMVTLARSQPVRRAPALRLVRQAHPSHYDTRCDVASCRSTTEATPGPAAASSRDAEPPSPDAEHPIHC
jgi:hypothetical protein